MNGIFYAKQFIGYKTDAIAVFIFSALTFTSSSVQPIFTKEEMVLPIIASLLEKSVPFNFSK